MAMAIRDRVKNALMVESNYARGSILVGSGLGASVAGYSYATFIAKTALTAMSASMVAGLVASATAGALCAGFIALGTIKAYYAVAATEMAQKASEKLHKEFNDSYEFLSHQSNSALHTIQAAISSVFQRAKALMPLKQAPTKVVTTEADPLPGETTEAAVPAVTTEAALPVVTTQTTVPVAINVDPSAQALAILPGSDEPSINKPLVPAFEAVRTLGDSENERASSSESPASSPSKRKSARIGKRELKALHLN